MPFQVHGVDASGRVVVAKAMRRNKLLEFFASLPACLVGLEASGSAHHWARELVKLGHQARMMPPAYVKPYIRRQKNDAADAAAICEAVRNYCVGSRGAFAARFRNGRSWRFGRAPPSTA